MSSAVKITMTCTRGLWREIVEIDVLWMCSVLLTTGKIESLDWMTEDVGGRGHGMSHDLLFIF